jgi:hypothetical protein
MESSDDITDCLSTHTKGPGYLGRGAFSPVHANDLALESDKEGLREGKTLIVGVESRLRKKEKYGLLIPLCIAIDMVWFLPLVANHIFQQKKNAHIIISGK